MKTFLTVLSVLQIVQSSFAQGFIYGRKVRHDNDPIPIYRLSDPCNLTGDKTRVSGAGANYTAEIWFAFGENRSEPTLTALQLSSRFISPFGELPFGLAVIVPDTKPGDIVTLQIRVWENQGGKVSSWKDAIRSTTAAFGRSILIPHYELGGVKSDGTPVFAKSIFLNLPGFDISAACPEPSSYLLLGLAAVGAAVIRRRKF